MRRVEFAMGACVLCRCDLGHPPHLRVLNRMPFASVKMVVHAAGVLRDALLINQTDEKVKDVFGPKVQGAWQLHA